MIGVPERIRVMRPAVADPRERSERLNYGRMEGEAP
jgi:hypothetical protein